MKRRELAKLLSRVGAEKMTEIISIKMSYSLLEALRQTSDGGVSAFVRQTLTQRLQEMVADGK